MCAVATTVREGWKGVVVLDTVQILCTAPKQIYGHGLYCKKYFTSHQNKLFYSSKLSYNKPIK